MKKAEFILVLILLIFAQALLGCATSSVAVIDNVNQPPAAAEDETLVITAVGDIMMHDTQITAGYRPSTGDYDFLPFFAYVTPLFKASNLVIGNLETTFSGKKEGYSGYPRFNTPEILASNLKDAGFDILSTANNHCLDKGQAGLVSTLDYLDKAGLLHTGTARSKEEHDSILITERKGVKLAVLAYTFGTNGINPAQDRGYSVNYLDVDKITSDIKKARDNQAQLVIISLHFGEEYRPHPGPLQQEAVKSLLDAGADIILGHHPHVLQPASVFNQQFVIYSLGNFISAQQGLERRSSVILNLFFGIDGQTKQPYFKKAAYIPIYTRSFRDKGKLCYEVLPVEPALTSIRSGQIHNFSRDDIRNLEDSWKHITGIFSAAPALVELQPLNIPLEGLNYIQTWH